LPGAVVAVLSGIGFWMLLMAGVVATPRSGDANASSSELAQVDDRDTAAAFTTMDRNPALRAQFDQKARACPQPLAWVAIERAPGQPAGTIRLQSGQYFSPVFDLTDAPMRIAIPYPGPYDTGQGTLTALGSGGAGVIALSPPWRLGASGENATRHVTWPVVKRCAGANG
jgi:hypothetical protein